MRISSKGKYAIEAMIYIAHLSNGLPMQAKVIAQKVGTTESYLEQIFFKLRKGDLLDTIRGPRGGYLIKHLLEEITVKQILQSVEGDISLVPCVKKDSEYTCQMKDVCTTKSLWQNLNHTMEEAMSHITLQELLQGYCEELQETYGALEYYL